MIAYKIIFLFVDDTMLLLTRRERDLLSRRGLAISDLEMLKILFDQTVYRSAFLRQCSCLLLSVHFILITCRILSYTIGVTTTVQFVERVTWNGPFRATKNIKKHIFPFENECDSQ